MLKKKRHRNVVTEGRTGGTEFPHPIPCIPSSYRSLFPRLSPFSLALLRLSNINALFRNFPLFLPLSSLLELPPPAHPFPTSCTPPDLVLAPTPITPPFLPQVNGTYQRSRVSFWERKAVYYPSSFYFGMVLFTAFVLEQQFLKKCPK